MHPRSTNMQAEAHDAFEHIFDSAGALAFVNEYSESAAPPALSNAFAERKQACPFSPRYHTLGGDTGSVSRQRNLRRLSASTGRMPNTIAVDKPPALRTGSFCASITDLTRSTRGSKVCARGSTVNLLPYAWNSIKGPSCLRCATRSSSGSCPSLRSPWPETAKR